jgi:hypothetical protein
MVQAALPAQSRVQPPCGQATLQVLSPVQLRVEFAPSATLQELPPPHVTVLFAPASSEQLLVPSHVEVQFEPQLPAQEDWPAQLVVHPVPHVTSHVFLTAQLYATLFATAPASPPLPVAVPNVHVPPLLHEHVFPAHVQAPEHVATPAGPASRASLEDAASASGTLDTLSLESLPQPTARLAAATRAPTHPRKTMRSFDMDHLPDRIVTTSSVHFNLFGGSRRLDHGRAACRSCTDSSLRASASQKSSSPAHSNIVVRGLVVSIRHGDQRGASAWSGASLRVSPTRFRRAVECGQRCLATSRRLRRRRVWPPSLPDEGILHASRT